MRRTAIALALALVCLAGPPAAADQTSPRLDALFERLQSAEDPVTAQVIQGRIWSLWFEHDDPQVRMLMDEGRAAMDARRFDEALELFSEVIERDPNYAEGWNRRATLYYLMGRFEKSLADINKVLALEPRHFGALSGRGLVLIRLDRLHEAIDAFQAALEVNPHMQRARANIEHLREVLEKREI